MRLVVALLAVTLTLSVLAAPADEVRATELAFAKAFADRDKAKFFSFVSDDATFFSAGVSLRGKQRVVDVWSRYFEGPQAPFAWAPDRVSVSADGTLGLSSGPVFDPNGNHSGNFISTWRKQADGSWKIVFDSSGPSPAIFAADATPVEEGFITTPDGAKLYYRKAGRSPRTVIVPYDLLLHARMKQLADIATVITYDMRNRGRSSRTENGGTIEHDIRDLETVRAHFKLEKFIPIGFSYLGKMVMLYTAAHPEHVSRVIQLGPVSNAPLPPPQPDRNFGASAEAIAKWQGMDPATANPREYCLAQWEALRYYLVGDPKNGPRVEIEEMCSLETEWPVNLNKQFATMIPSLEARVLSADELKKITVPVLTIHGTKDRNALYAGGQAWVSSLPNARLVTLEGAAHAMWIDDPVGTFAAIRAFLRGD